MTTRRGGTGGQENAQSDSTEAIIENRIKIALDASPGSKAAIRNAQEAIFLSVAQTIKSLQPALAPIMEPADSGDAAAIRKSWVGKLRFLNGCLALPDLSSLSVALQELDRGVTADALIAVGNRRGGKSKTEGLHIMSYMVEAADELKSRCDKHEEYREKLKGCNTAHSTIEKHRKAILNLPEFAPRLGWQLYWREDPETVLKQLVTARKTLHKKDGK